VVGGRIEEHAIIAGGMKTKTFLARLGSEDSFPLELTLAGGERHLALHPAYAYVHPASGRLCLFSERRSCDVALDPAEVVRLRPLGGRPGRQRLAGSSV